MERLGQLGLVERLSGDTVVETVEERIKEQVRVCAIFVGTYSSHQVQTSRGSFDCSYLAPLQSWLDR